jgi:hypothetical protein
MSRSRDVRSELSFAVDVRPEEQRELQHTMYSDDFDKLLSSCMRSQIPSIG